MSLPKVIRTLRDNTEAVLLPAGTYVIGIDAERVAELIRQLGEKPDPLFSAELPRHTVTLHDVFIDRFPVTNARYAAFLTATNGRSPEYWLDPRYNHPDQPVTGISWHEAAAYASWAGKRLPTEEEWEAAARGTDERIWPWGNTFEKGYCNSREWHSDRPLPVGSMPRGISPVGCHDMAGNIWEFTSTDWQYMGKVIRGGSYQHSAAYCRTTCRWAIDPDLRGKTTIGFRCCMDIAKARIYGKALT
ncbi:MAG: SUMF1/EgtB/PvdO family nonheme iron enzyme [candidate division WOR-3 bacterium]